MHHRAMTERFWLTCDDPRPMLEQVREQASPRKLRWFACACARSVWSLLGDPRSRVALEVAERFADGRADAVELAQASVGAVDAAETDLRTTVSEPNWAAARAAARTASCDAYGAASGAAFVAALCFAPWEFDSTGAVLHHGDPAAKADALRQQATLLREILGNPYQPPSFLPHWRICNDAIATRLAMHIYQSRQFDEMPILGDALEEAGCADESILEHCRGGGHVPGCWVIDLVLGKW